MLSHAPMNGKSHAASALAVLSTITRKVLKFRAYYPTFPRWRRRSPLLDGAWSPREQVCKRFLSPGDRKRLACPVPLLAQLPPGHTPEHVLADHMAAAFIEPVTWQEVPKRGHGPLLG